MTGYAITAQPVIKVASARKQAGDDVRPVPALQSPS